MFSAIKMLPRLVFWWRGGGGGGGAFFRNLQYSDLSFSELFVRFIIIFVVSSLGPFVHNYLIVINAYFHLKYHCLNKDCCENALILQPTPGNIGNQLFQYATLYAHAKGHRLTPFYIKGGWMKMDIFRMFKNLTIKEATCDTDASPIRFIGSPMGCCFYNKRLEEIGRSWTNYKIAGFFQSWKHFDFARPLLLKEFEMKPEFEKKALDFINSTTEKVGRNLVINIGIHVRRTDFVSLENYGYCPSNEHFIKRAVHYVNSRIMLGNTPVFYVVGDDLAWMKKNLMNISEHVIIVDKPIRSNFVDFAILKNMDVVILSAGASTYGWMAAYLNTKAKFVVYNYHRDKYQSSLSKQTVLADYFYPTWIPLL